MTKWRDIETAPKDGTVVRARRIHEGKLVYDGPAAWRTIRLERMVDPLSGKVYADARSMTWWAHPTGNHLVPTPTQWMPA